MTTRAKLTLYSALATGLVTLCMTPLLTLSNWVMHAFLLIAAAAGAGAGLRRLAVPRAVLVPLQLLIVLYVLLLTTVQSSMFLGVLPGGPALNAISTRLADGGSDIQSYAIPAPATPGLRLILVGSVALIAVVVDALAVTFRRAAAAGLPLLALFSVGTGLAGSGTAWLWFLLGAGGYLLLLFAEGQDRLSRWGRVFHGSSQGGNGTLSHSGHRVGLLALALAMVLPVLIPHGGVGLFDSGSGDGSGKGSGGRITSLNPVVALTANLNRADNVELLHYTTDSSADSMYLRIGALDSFNGVEWKFSEQPLENVSSPLPPAPGLSGMIPSTPVSTKIRISDNLSTDWLPMPYPADSVQVPGNWRFEPATRALIGDNGQKTAGLVYQVDSLDLHPSADQLRAADHVPADIAQRYLALPANLPQVVGDTARQVTNGKQSAYDRAVALQDWFSTSGGFSYSLKVEAGTGNDAIARFLRDKTGFCVHFAATMAAMARSLNIPARVAIGFAPGEDQGQGNFVVHSKDYHAWPELYFPGSGWLRFEPTPTRGAPPDYTKDQAAPAPGATAQQPTAAATTDASPAPSASSSCDARQRRAGDCPSDAQSAALTAHQTPWWLSWQALGGFAAAILVLGLLLTPMLWRVRLRRRRLGAGRHLPGAGRSDLGDVSDDSELPDLPGLTDQQVLAAWQELIDTAWDLGIPPDDARTPRGTVRRIAETGELDATAAAAAGRVALATEQVLYAREPAPQASLGPDVRIVGDGLRVWAGRRGRVRALLLPASSVRLWWQATERVADLREGARTRTSRATAPARALAARILRRKHPDEQ